MLNYVPTSAVKTGCAECSWHHTDLRPQGLGPVGRICKIGLPTALIPFNFLQKRQQFATKHFDEADSDRRLAVTEDNFKVTIFYSVIDTTLLKLKERFVGMKSIYENFNILVLYIMTTKAEESLVKSSYDFINKYRNDISSDFTLQILFLMHFLLSNFECDVLKKMTIQHLAKHIVNNKLSIVFPDVVTSCYICMTIPVISASAERSLLKT